MLSMATGAVGFVLVEFVYLKTVHNLEAGFLPAVVVAFIIAVGTTVVQARCDHIRDNPEPLVYRVEAPLAIARIKRVLRTFYSGRHRWMVNYEDRDSGEIQASMFLVDDSFSEMTWLVPSGRVEKTINAEIRVTPGPGGASEVRISFVVDASYSRADCNEVIEKTLSRIDEALQDAQDGVRARSR